MEARLFQSAPKSPMPRKDNEPPPGHWKHLSWHKAGGWEAQYRRMLRWHERAREAMSRPTLTESDIDQVIAFFQNCYHLKDWVAGSADPSKLKALFDDTEMGICRDICNGTKHFTLNRPSSVDAYFNIGREEVPYFSAGKLSPRKEGFVIAAGEKYDLIDLMARCVGTWRSFLIRCGLLPDGRG